MNETSSLYSIKNCLRQERIQRNWRQQDVADYVGTTVATVKRWERGSQQPSAYYREKLCALFGKSAEALGLILEDPHWQSEMRIGALIQIEDSAISQAPTSSNLWSVPYSRNPFFTGREELLLSLHEKLTCQHTLALTQPWALSGLGGIGKTQIALEYAYQYRHEYRFVFWVNASTQETLFSDFVAIAHILQLPEKDEHECNHVIQAVKQWLGSHHEWLLILDNADDLTIVYDIVPKELSGHILLTTRAQALGPLGQRLEVETMGMAEATLFLLRRAKFLSSNEILDHVTASSLQVAETLAIEMDFFPLALDQAGAYIEEVGCSFANYLALYRTNRRKLLGRRGQMTISHPESVITTWSLSFQKVKQTNPAAADLLRLCAFLEPDSIPEELISQGNAFFGSVLQPVAGDAFRFNEAIEELRKFSLIQRDPDLGLLRIHRLVQLVLKDAMDSNEQCQWMERVVRATNAVFPEVVEMTTWSRCQRLLSQAQMCSVYIQNNAFAFAEAASLLFRTASYLHDYALYEQAESLFQRVLHIWKQMGQPEHAEVARTLVRLADLYLAQSKLEQAERLFAQIITMQERSLMAGYPHPAETLNSLAFVYREQGKYEQAESLCLRALTLQEQSLEPDHPHLAETLNNLGVLYWRLGKYEQAEPLFIRTLKIREKVLGSDHPHIAYALGNLALLYREQNKYEQAEPLFVRALCIYERHLGPDHPHTATGLNNLALLYRDQGKYELAEPLYRRALKIREQRREIYHTDTALLLGNLADLYRVQGHYEQAEPLYQRALSIYEQQVGSDHPLMAKGLHNLAMLYCDQGKYELAEPLYRRALMIREQQLGSDHLHTAETSHALATVRDACGDHQEAATLYRRALVVREQILGPQHPKACDSRERLSMALQAIGKTAGTIHREALQQKPRKPK
jgi:tetratricopeptide (TPR) repeat protein/transcriptional regulator with XRE-family HTH domain